jgi:DNA-binding NtrC family response regulator
MMAPKILLVDDEANILSAFKRKFRKHFDIRSALGAAEGLGVLESSGPFAVVVSDLRMPGMDGIQFLGEVKNRAPDTVRIMLTGHATQHLVANAVELGHIFRVLTKPCPLLDLFKSIEDGIDQYQRQTSAA